MEEPRDELPKSIHQFAPWRWTWDQLAAALGIFICIAIPTWLVYLILMGPNWRLF